MTTGPPPDAGTEGGREEAADRPAGGAGTDRYAARRAAYDLAPGQRRLFVAIPLSEAARADVAALVGRVRVHEETGDRARTARWVRLDGLHITLRFLGPTPDDRVDAVGAAARSVAAATHPFDIRLSGAGAFPSARHPRALWLGVVDGADELADLAGRLGRELEAAGWPLDDRPFRSHLTLARTDGVRSGPTTARLLTDEAASFDAGWQADRIVVFESLTGGGPARYEPHVVASFGGA